MSFGPFAGGRRVCIGKSFVDMVVRFTIPLIYKHLDFEYTNPKELDEPKSDCNFAVPRPPKYMMKLISRN